MKKKLAITVLVFSTAFASAQNTNQGSNSQIAAGINNIIVSGSRNAFIGAGSGNAIDGANNFNSVIVGGIVNSNLAGRATIVGGRANTIGLNSRSSTISGGETNSILANTTTNTSLNATIGGGQANIIAGGAIGATIGGGSFNDALAPGATVPGGFANEAAGTNSFAAGSQAVASNTGTFVWSDMSSTNDFISTADNQFLIRATGGVGINTNNPGSNALLVNGSAQIATNLTVGGNLSVTGTINGTFTNLTASSLTTSNNVPIELKPGDTTGLIVTPQGTADLALTNPDVVTTYVGTGHNIIGGFNSHFVAFGVVGATIAGGGRLVISNDVDGASTNFNQVLDHFGTVSGGTANSAAGLMATVSGGSGNWAGGHWATIGGGLDNMIMDPTNIPPNALDISTIAGGFMNQVLNSPGGTIGGGSANLITNTNVLTTNNLPFTTTIAGGTQNISTNASGSFIGGGYANNVSGDFTTLVGGSGNIIPKESVNTNYPESPSTNLVANAAIVGGLGNLNGGVNGFIGGGSFNNIQTGDNFPLLDIDNATIAGGNFNRARGAGATVPGGVENHAFGDDTFAAGVKARATNPGSFVWSGTYGTETASTNDYSFTVRAPGGARFISTSDTVLTNTNHGVILLPNAVSWTSLSDRESKTDYQPVSPREILSRLAAMPVTSWQYKHDPSRRYIGPTAQDFMSAFHLGNNDKGINTLDADGVTFAAIQGLVEELKDRDKAIAELKNEMQALREQIQSALPPAK
jgi:hypothetical protein